MGTRVLREPTYETTDDAQAGTLMSCGQLLYINGLLERADIDTMNSLVGREPEHDTPLYDLACIMYRAGFRELLFGTFDVIRALEDFSYWCDFIGETCADEQVTAELRETWEHWRKAGQTSQRLSAEFPEHITEVGREATLSDVDRLLADSHAILTCVETLPMGYGIFGLILDGNKDDGYRVYHPRKGAASLSAAELFPDGSIEISAFKLPEGLGTPVTLPA